MNQELHDIIHASSFEVSEGEYIYTRVKKAPEIGKHFMVTSDKDEITVVTRAENLDSLDLDKKNKDRYSLIALNVSIPFYSVGFLAAVCDVIAEAGLNILVVSTYSKDYIMVKSDCLKVAQKALVDMGFTQK